MINMEPMKQLMVTAKNTLSVASVLDWYNALVGGGIVLLTGILGEQWYLFMGFFAFNVFDWLTGWYKARRLKIESSAAGLRGIVKKLFYWMLVAGAFMVAYVFENLGEQMFGVNMDFMNVLGWMVLTMLFVNEARSVCENLVAAGIGVPQLLIKGLAVGKKLLEDKAASLLPDDGLDEGE